jgi:hypothetical protein
VQRELRRSLALGSDYKRHSVDPNLVVEQAHGPAQWQPSRLLRHAAPLSFASSSAAGIARSGFPTSADRLLLWLTFGMISWSLFDRQRARRLALEWLPFLALVLAYDLLRGRADHVFTGAHALPQIWISERLGHGTVPVVWLQHHLWHGAADLRWYDYACFAVYVSHFLVTPLLAGLLWLKAPHLFRRYAAMVLTLAFLGVITYALFPAFHRGSQVATICSRRSRASSQTSRHTSASSTTERFSRGAAGMSTTSPRSPRCMPPTPSSRHSSSNH